MKLDQNSDKLKIEYPCHWTYKVIGLNQESIKQAIKEIIKVEQYSIDLSNKSKSGKYCCMNLELFVVSEDDRNSIYTALKGHTNIIMLL